MEEIKISREKKRRFIALYCILRNIKEASAKAGIDTSGDFNEGIEHLLKKSTRRQLKKFNDRLSSDSGAVSAGLSRLAFGSVNDAALLVFSQDTITEEKLSELDLFNVSEVKRDKDGGVSVKFFDRQKALEKMWEIENTTDTESGAESFLKALCESEHKETDNNDDDSI